MLYFEKYVRFEIPRKREYIFNDSTKLSLGYVMFYIKALCDSCMMDFIGCYMFGNREGRTLGDL